MRTSYKWWRVTLLSLVWVWGVVLSDETTTTSIDIIRKLETNEGVIQFDEAQFKKFAHQPRDYAMFVALTVSGMKCEPCVILNKVLERIAVPLPMGPAGSKLVIGSLPYEKAPVIFQQYKLTSAPNLYFFPASDKKTKDPKYEVYKASASGFDIDLMAQFLTRQVGAEVTYVKPFPWAFYGTVVASLLSAVGAFYLVYYKFTSILFSVRTWSAFSMVFLLTMLSGQMWNSIRGANFARYSRDGALEWFASGFQEQYGMESQIVAVAYGLATFVLIQLGTTAPNIKRPLVQSGYSILLILTFLLAISFIAALFKRKFPPYPYNIFLK